MIRERRWLDDLARNSEDQSAKVKAWPALSTKRPDRRLRAQRVLILYVHRSSVGTMRERARMTISRGRHENSHNEVVDLQRRMSLHEKGLVESSGDHEPTTQLRL